MDTVTIEEAVLEADEPIVGDEMPLSNEPEPEPREPLTPEQQLIADTIAKSDDLYVPSDGALANTQVLLNEIQGHSLQGYDSKEAFFTGHSVVCAF